jgi:hypothetical protein
MAETLIKGMTKESPDHHPESTEGELGQLVLHQGELYLGGQLHLATATQARATTLTGIFLPAATALGGVALAQGDRALLWAGIASAVLLLAGGLGCLVAAVLPSELHVSGSEPKRLIEALRHGSLSEVVGFEAENYQTMADRNRRVIRRYVYRLRAGGFTAAAAPFVGGLTWAALSFGPACLR